MVKYISLKKLKLNLSDLKRLGIDEITMQKGRDKFIVVLVDLDRKHPIGFGESRKQKDIKQVLEGWGSEVLLGVPKDRITSSIWVGVASISGSFSCFGCYCQ